MKNDFTFIGVSEGTVGLHAFFLELTGFVGVEAVLSVTTVGEEGTLNVLMMEYKFGGLFIL